MDVLTITPEDVLKAYEETGLKPIEEEFLTTDNTCACLVTTMYAYKTSVDEMIKTWRNSHTSFYDLFAEKFDIKDDDIYSKYKKIDTIYYGFDDLKSPSYIPSKESPLYPYYMLGLESRKLVLEKYGTLRPNYKWLE